MTVPPDVSGDARWLGYAHEGLEHAESTLESDDPIYRWVCVAAHQAAEKALKAALIRAEVEFP